jgi:hypothetical protein
MVLVVLNVVQIYSCSRVHNTAAAAIVLVQLYSCTAVDLHQQLLLNLVGNFLARFSRHKSIGF